MKDKPVVVMGLGPSGLFIVRQLHNITDNIYAIGRTDDVGMFSKYLRKEKRYYAQSEEAVFESLKKIYGIEGNKPTVFLCSDQYLTTLINSNHDWSLVCEIAGTNLETLRLINNKELITRYCGDIGIQIPQTIDMVSFNIQKEQKFPVIVKWKEKALEAKANPIGKVLVCKDEEEYNTMQKALEKSWVKQDMLLVQTFIEGNNDYQYSVGGYYHDGLPLAHVTVKQVKQYPQGISAQVYTTKDEISEKVEKIAFDFAKQFHFSGFLETEFKIDQKTGNIFLLDINPRPWGWVSILGAAFPCFYKVLGGETLENERREAIWTSPLRNFLSSKNHRNVEVQQKTNDFAKSFDIADREDRWPSFMVLVMAVKKVIMK